jgi:hypothetical protein
VRAFVRSCVRARDAYSRYVTRGSSLKPERSAENKGKQERKNERKKKVERVIGVLSSGKHARINCSPARV